MEAIRLSNALGAELRGVDITGNLTGRTLGLCGRASRSIDCDSVLIVKFKGLNFT